MKMNTSAAEQSVITMQVVNSLGLQYKKTSRDELNIYCPFHPDKNPSMFIEISTGRYHCFSCNRGGHISTLYKELTGRSMYKDLGLAVDSFSSFSIRNIFNTEETDTGELTLKKVFITTDYSAMINPYMDSKCAEYLDKRGISKDIVRTYGLKFSERVFINNTLFKNRLIIPVYENHKIISFEGRRLADDGSPKVLYPKHCTTNTLFDIDNLKRDEPLYVVEGLMDLFVLKSCDCFRNSTSIFGACLTKRQIELLKDFEKVIFIPDADEAGERPLKLLKEQGLDNVYVLRLPDQIEGFPIKDVGDLPKINKTPDFLIEKNWLNYITKN